MIKKRNILWGFLILALAAGVTAYYVMPLWKIGRKLERHIEANIRDTFGPTLQVKRVQLGLGSIYIHRIAYATPDSMVQLNIRDIRLKLNLGNLIKFGVDPLKVIEDVIIRKPTVVVRFRPNGSDDSLNVPLTTSPEFRRKVLEFSSIKKITINDARLLLETGEEPSPFPIFQQANGWVQATQNSKAVAKLAARLFQSNDYNVIVRGDFDLISSTLDSLVLHIRRYILVETVPFFDPPYLKLKDGYLQGRVRFVPNPTEGEPRLSGHVEIQNGSGVIVKSGLQFSEAHLRLRLYEQDLLVEEGSQAVLNGSTVAMAGQIVNFARPQLDLTVSADSLDMGAFLQAMTRRPPFRVSGIAKVRIRVEKSLQEPVLTGSLAARRLHLGRFQLKDLKAFLNYQNSILSFDKISANYKHCQLQGWGQIPLQADNQELNINLLANGEFSDALPVLQTLRVPSSTGAIMVTIGGSSQQPIIEGNFDLTLQSPSDQRVNLLGQFEAVNYDLLLDARSAEGDFKFQGQILHFLDNPTFQFRVQHLDQIAYLWPVPFIQTLSRWFKFDGRVCGEPDRLRFDLEAYSPRTRQQIFDTNFDIHLGGSQKLNFGGTLAIHPDQTHPLMLDFKGALSDSLFTLDAGDNDDWLYATVQARLDDQRKLMGQLRLSGVDFVQLLGEKGLSREKYGGKLFGRINLDGTVDRPEGQVEAWFLNGLLNGDGVFSGELSGALHDSRFTLEKFVLQYEGRPYIQAYGFTDLSRKWAEFNIQGKNIDTNTLIHAITGHSDVLLGRADMDVSLQGNGWPMNLYGNIRIQNGRVVWFTFDDLTFNFGEPAKSSESAAESYLTPKGFYAKSIAYIKQGQYVLNGEGWFPFSKVDSMDVTLQGFGNFLATLPDFATVFLETQSIGELRFRLKGPYKSVRIYDMHAKILNGRMRLSRVAKEIREITAEAVADGDFIHIKKLEGRIGDARLRIHNFRETPVRAGHLGAPLRIAHNWMSLGTLVVNSTKNGLPLHIPALMEKGEIGRFWIRGRKGEPGFLIGGPWAHPVFRGEVVLYNVNVTFPFDGGDDKVDPLIANILFNIDWDVVAIAGKDNRYVKKIPSGIDNIYVNIAIDNEVSQLHFTGIFLDTTRAALTRSNGADSLELAAELANGLTADSLAGGSLQFLVSQRRPRPTGPDTSSFRIEGVIESTRGNIEYLDLNFRVDKFGAIWDRSELQPIVYGRAWTTVTDSTNFPQNVYLKLYARDPVTGEERARGRWEYSYFKLESDIPIYNNSQLNLLATLGYSLDNVKEKATDMIGISTDNLLFRPLLRPVERTLERSLGLDIVRLNSRFTRNFLEMNLVQPIETKWALLRSTRLTVGKYLSSRLFFLYTGQLEAWPPNFKYQDPNLGLRHTFGLEYRFNPGLLLQMEYDVNNALADQREDKKIWIRHSFPLK